MVDASERNVLMINYIVGATRGNIRLYRIDRDGMIGDNTEMIEHDGSSGANPDRQEVSHPHMIVTTPDNRFAVVPDLGTDKVYLYALDSERRENSAFRKRLICLPAPDHAMSPFIRLIR